MSIWKRLFSPKEQQHEMQLKFPQEISGSKKKSKEEVQSQVYEEWEQGSKKVEKMSNETLEQLIEDTRSDALIVILAAYELSKRGCIDVLTKFMNKNSNQAIAGVEGLCYASCNGNSSATEAVSAAIYHTDPKVRLRLVKSLSMIADGTPGGIGVSTLSIRERARMIIKAATKGLLKNKLYN